MFSRIWKCIPTSGPSDKINPVSTSKHSYRSVAGASHSGSHRVAGQSHHSATSQSFHNENSRLHSLGKDEDSIMSLESLPRSHHTSPQPSKSIPMEMAVQHFPQGSLEMIQWLLDNFGRYMFLKVPHHTLMSWVYTLWPKPSVHTIAPLTPSDMIDRLGQAIYCNNIPQLAELTIVASFIATQRENNIALPWPLIDFMAFRAEWIEILNKDMLGYLEDGPFAAPTQQNRNSRIGTTPQPNAPPAYTPVSTNVYRVSMPNPPWQPTSHRPTSMSRFNCASPSPKRGEQMDHQRDGHSLPSKDPTEMVVSVPSQGSVPSQDMDEQDDYDDIPPESLRSRLSSIRKRRSIEHIASHSAAKTRSFVGSDKLKWEKGHVDTFQPFYRDAEGTLIKLGMGYLLEEVVQDDYIKYGVAIAQSTNFYDTYGISAKQFKYDIQYLYGLLQGATKGYDNPHVIANRKTKDGIRTWLGIVQDNDHDGSLQLRKTKLKMEIEKKYHSRDDIGVYLNHFHSISQQLKALDSNKWTDNELKETLLEKLQSDPSLTPLIWECEKDVNMTLLDCIMYIKSKALVAQYHQRSTTTPRRVQKTQGSQSVDNVDEDMEDDMQVDDEVSIRNAFKTIESIVQADGLVKAYNTLSSQEIRRQLNIPSPVWAELEPELREKVMAAKRRAREKLMSQQGNTPNNNNRSLDQYPKKQVTIAEQVKTMVTRFNDMDVDDDEESTDDDEIRHVKVTTSHDCISINSQVDRFIALSNKDSRLWSYMDNCSDSCVLGAGAHIIEHAVGRYATLSGVDSRTMQSDKLPIASGYIKCQTMVGVPVVLKINEAPSNPDCPVTVLSEYQVREHGYIIDAVAKKHRKLGGEYGTQSFYLHDELHIDLIDRGGVMAFEILPWEEGDEERFEVYEITSPEKWIPSSFRDNSTTQSTTTHPTYATRRPDPPAMEPKSTPKLEKASKTARKGATNSDVTGDTRDVTPTRTAKSAKSAFSQNGEDSKTSNWV